MEVGGQPHASAPPLRIEEEAVSASQTIWEGAEEKKTLALAGILTQERPARSLVAILTWSVRHKILDETCPHFDRQYFPIANIFKTCFAALKLLHADSPTDVG